MQPTSDRLPSGEHVVEGQRRSHATSELAGKQPGDVVGGGTAATWRRVAAGVFGSGLTALGYVLVRRGALALFAAAALVGCGGERDDAARQPQRSPFDYDRSQPLALRDRGVVNRGYPIPIHDVSFASPRGGRVTAYLLVPPGEGPKPAAIYLHGLGGSRAELAVPASWLAARGAVTLTVDSPAAHRGTGTKALFGVAALRQQRDEVIRSVVDVRRAVDVLASLPLVDPSRIALVGYSAGARSGAILAGVEPRLHSLVLMAGGATPLDAYAEAAPPHLRDDVVEILKVADPLRHIARARPGTLFFQNGRRDSVVPRDALDRLARAAGKQRVRWYDAGHAPNARAYRDQLAWLSERLGLKGPVVRGAASGP